jgi:uncharacterized protein YdaU (DUF1376 family)
MARDPAFLFYSSDFLTGISFLSFEERGKYITILCSMHQHGRLNEESISFLVGLVSVKLKSKFQVDENGFWFNKRLEEEIIKRNKFTESRRNNGIKGGRGNKSDKPNTYPNGKPKLNHMDNYMEDENENKDLSIINNSENQKNLIETFFKDLPNSSHIETIAINLELKKESVLNQIELFRPHAELSYPNFDKFCNHFKNWLRIKIEKNKAKAAEKPKPYNPRV